jgi:fatty-acyl-CoA synthase
MRCGSDSSGPCREPQGAHEICADGEPGELTLFNHLRTGDIVVRDAQGFVEFVDRQVGGFRQKGLNVSNEFVARTLRQAPTIESLGVTHLVLPRYAGSLGLLVMVPGAGFHIRDLEQAYQRLPEHARPRCLRITQALRLNRGLKFDALGYRAEGVDPARVDDPVYVYRASGFIRVDSDVWCDLQLGTLRF